MTEYRPYCYLIGWKHLKMYYYGSEYSNTSKIANPVNLWTTYFTSSKHVKEFVNKYGDPDVIEIRKIFTTAEKAIHWEYRALRKLKVRNNPLWLNINEGKAPVGVAWSVERKSEKSKQVSGSLNPMYNKLHTVETKLKISKKSGRKGSKNGMFGKIHTDAAKEKMSQNHLYASGKDHARFGKTHTESAKKKMSDSHKPKSFTFTHTTHGSVYATMRELIQRYPDLKFSGIKQLCAGRLNTYKTWVVS